MDGTTDHPSCAAARAAMIAARRSEHELLVAIRDMDTDGVIADSGYRSMRRLLEDLWRLDPAPARRLVAHAALLAPRIAAHSGETLPAALPATAAVAEQGLIGDGHLRVIAATMDRLARIPDLDPDTFAAAEADLAHHATQLHPTGLARVAARIEAWCDPDGAAPADDPDADHEVHLTRCRDGRLRGKIVFGPGADAETVLEVFDRLSAPAGPEDTRTLAQRHAETLTDLCATALPTTGIAAEAGADTRDDTGPRDDHHTDERGDDDDGDEGEGDEPREPATQGEPARPAARGGSGESGEPDRPVTRGESGESATDDDTGSSDDTGTDPGYGQGRPRVPRPLGRSLLTITIDHQWLRDNIGHGLLDSGQVIATETVRRLACDAGVVPMVLGARSEPLDVGRMSYTVPEAIRRALIIRDRGCSFPGCHRRPGRCHAHHIRHWLDHGETKLDNLTLLCRYHHLLIHHGHWTVQIVHGRPEYRPPPYIDPEQRPYAA